MATRVDALDLTVTARPECDAHVVAANGHLDLATAPSLCLGVQRVAAAGAPPRIVIDLRSVEFIDVPGVRALISAAQEIRALSGAIAVVATRGSQVDRLLTLAGAREFLAVTPAAHDAIALVGSGV